MKEQLFGQEIRRDADVIRDQVKPRPVHMVPTLEHRPPPAPQDPSHNTISEGGSVVGAIMVILFAGGLLIGLVAGMVL